MKKKRPVLQDVADRVGVTKMTVSRFLRNPEQVSVALRGKIAAALDELGYIPNRAPDILNPHLPENRFQMKRHIGQIFQSFPGIARAFLFQRCIERIFRQTHQLQLISP
eukprot:833662_1